MLAWLGIELDEVSVREKLVSALGGLVSITALVVLTDHLIGVEHAPLVLASMGASAVLLFAVPHGQLSQPWPVLAGHGISAVIGVASAQLISNTAVAAGVAVAVSILAMHQFKFIHPPGGATALTAVIGGPVVTGLGWEFVWRPVMINAVVMVALAVALNAPFPWRRYPAALSRSRSVAPGDPSHESVVAALRSLDSFIDVTEDDLVAIYRIVSARPAAADGPASSAPTPSTSSGEAP